MDTWDWAQSGKACSFKPERARPLNRSPKECGAVQRRPQWTRGLWVFTCSWHNIDAPAWQYMVDFYEAHPGTSFYLPWPVSLYGIPAIYGTADPADIGPWMTDIAPGFGDGPIITAWMDVDSLPFARIPGTENSWTTESPIIFRQE